MRLATARLFKIGQVNQPNIFEGNGRFISRTGFLTDGSVYIIFDTDPNANPDLPMISSLYYENLSRDSAVSDTLQSVCRWFKR